MSGFLARNGNGGVGDGDDLANRRFMPSIKGRGGLKNQLGRERYVRTPRERFPPKLPQLLEGFRYLFALGEWGTRERAKQKSLKIFGENGGRHRD